MKDEFDAKAFADAVWERLPAPKEQWHDTNELRDVLDEMGFRSLSDEQQDAVLDVVEPYGGLSGSLQRVNKSIKSFLWARRYEACRALGGPGEA